MSSEYLNLDEAADLLRVSKRTVRRMIQTKKLPAVRVGASPNGRLLVSRESLAAVLQAAR